MIANPHDSRLTIVFAGGGTGGHLYPALSVAEEIAKLRPDARIVFFGTARRVDQEILGRTPWEFVPQRLAPLSVRPWCWPAIVGTFHRAQRDVRSRFREVSPSAVLGSGGLASVPPLLAALNAGVPTALFNPDAVPGRANKFLARRVDAVFAQWEATREFLPKTRVEVTGCPVRPEFFATRREEAVCTFGLNAARRTLLITGASQGARTINEAAVANAEFLRSKAEWQILHLTGEADYEAVRCAYEEKSLDAVVLRYTHEMAAAFAAADLIVSRAGASTLAEITAVGRASILMPYPYHRDQHQLANANCLAATGGASIIRDEMDSAQNAAALRRALEALMDDDEARQQMAAEARKISRRGAAATLAERLLALAGGPIRGCSESLEGLVLQSR